MAGDDEDNTFDATDHVKKLNAKRANNDPKWNKWIPTTIVGSLAVATGAGLVWTHQPAGTTIFDVDKHNDAISRGINPYGSQDALNAANAINRAINDVKDSAQDMESLSALQDRIFALTESKTIGLDDQKTILLAAVEYATKNVPADNSKFKAIQECLIRNIWVPLSTIEFIAGGKHMSPAEFAGQDYSYPAPASIAKNFDMKADPLKAAALKAIMNQVERERASPEQAR